MGNWETLGKHARGMNVSSSFYCPFLKPHHTLKQFASKGVLSLTLLRGNLLACEQGLSKLQIPFSVPQLTIVKLSEVILQQTAYIQGIIVGKLLRMVEP